jgi:hypothetical protein
LGLRDSLYVAYSLCFYHGLERRYPSYDNYPYYPRDYYAYARAAPIVGTLVVRRKDYYTRGIERIVLVDSPLVR